MKTYTVKLERTVTEIATLTVTARDKRTAAFEAASQSPDWQTGERTPLKILAIDVVAEPQLALVSTEPTITPHTGKRKVVSV